MKMGPYAVGFISIRCLVVHPQEIVKGFSFWQKNIRPAVPDMCPPTVLSRHLISDSLPWVALSRSDRLLSYWYTMLPSKILWKSCFGNWFLFYLVAESIVLIQKYLTQEYWKPLEKSISDWFFHHRYKGTLRTLIVIVLIFSGIFKGKSFFLACASSNRE